MYCVLYKEIQIIHFVPASGNKGHHLLDALSIIIVINYYYQAPVECVQHSIFQRSA